MKLTISEPETRSSGPIMIFDEDHNDVAEFYHNEHATVAQSYETALALAQQLVTATVEKDRLARLVVEMLDHQPRSIYGKPDVRVALACAASAVRRGRHLTHREQLLNLAKGMEEPVEGETPEEIARSKAFADRIRKVAGAA